MSSESLPHTVLHRSGTSPSLPVARGFVIALLTGVLLFGGLLPIIALAAPAGLAPTAPAPLRATPSLAGSGVTLPASAFTPVRGTLTGTVTVGSLPPFSGAPRTTVSLPPEHGVPRASPAPATLTAAVYPLQITTANGSPFLSIPHSGEGINANQCGCAPPDVQVAAGPAQEVEMVNLEGAVFAGDGSLDRSFSLSTFWGSGSDFLSDPKVLYDNGSGRWFASILEYSSTLGGLVRVAASSSSDPNGTWHVYAISTPSSTFGDQPILGVSSDTVGVSGDIFSVSNGNYYGAAYWVINKSQALAGASSLAVTQFGPDPSTFSLHPVQSVSYSPDLFVTMTNYGGTTSFVEVFDVAGVPPANLSVTVTNVTVASITPAPSAVQSGTSEMDDTGDSRVLTSVWNAGTLWLGFNDQCQLPSDTAPRSCARLVSINTTSGTLLQDFDVSLNGSYLYYPALAVSSDGFLSLLLGASSSTLYPSLLVTGRLPTDAPATLQTAMWLIQGSVSQACGTSVCRYGDYFGAGTIPGSSNAWVAGEYGGSSAAWQTRLGEVALRGPLGFAMSASPSAIEVGQSTRLTFTLLNSTCRGSVYCSVNVPLAGAPTYTSGCITGFSSASATATFSTPGNYTLGAGGWATTYSTGNCTEASRIDNVSLIPTVVRVAPSLGVSILSSPTGIADVGQLLSFRATPSGGAPPFAYHWTSLPSGCLDSGASSVSCLAVFAGPVTVRIQVQDGYGVFVNGTLAYWIDPAPSASLTAVRPTIELGQILELSGAASGGSGTYSYAWNGLPPGCGTADVALLSCAPSSSGSFVVNLTVTDTNGVSVTSSAAAVYVLPPLSATLTASSRAAVVGSDVTFSAAVTGGLGPFSYTWHGLPPGCQSQNSPTITCTPSESGNFSVTVSVVDALGGNAASSVPVAVNSSTSSSLDFSLFLLIGIVVAVVAAAAVLVVLLRRRRR